MVRLLEIFATISGLSFLLLYYSDGAAAPLLDQPVAVVVAISMLVGALSMAFHTFLDSVAKDLPKSTNALDAKRSAAIDALSALRKEVIENVMLVLVMLVFYAALGSAMGSLAPRSTWVDWTLLSVRFSCLAVIVYGAVVQFLGFRVATTLRDVLIRNS